MKRLKLHIISLIAALITIASACTDDLLYDPNGIGEGTVRISATVQFEPQASALESRATDGQAMRDINTLSVVLYNVNDTLTPIIYNLRPDEDFTVRTEKNLPDDYKNDKDEYLIPAEESTATASFTLPEIEVGQYYMYAVANMGVLTPEEVGTPHQLKHIKLRWNKGNVASNNQMFGYFMNVKDGSNGLSDGFDNGPVTVSRNSTTFHAWLKRAASKVTIVYDGSALHNEIDVYIHKVTIHDIPQNCYLGADNKPGEDDVFLQGESIYYNSAGEQLAEDPAPEYEQYESWMRVSRGSGKKGAVSEVDGKKVYHSEKSTALYFYENLQGNYEKDADYAKYDKRQDSTKVGTIINHPDQPDYKDNVPYGTYIEVEAFYISKHAPIISSGKIKYRFMLGLNHTYDYNAFRNNHYKLTLKFNGYANQADWHIEYVEEIPELYVPHKYYVSYLYNQEALFPIRVKGNCVYLDCEIIENNWAPYDSTKVDEVPYGSIESYDNFQWGREFWDNSGGNGNYKYGRKSVPVDAEVDSDFKEYAITKVITPVWVGFLALTVPPQYEDEERTRLPTGIFNSRDHDYRQDKFTTNNENADSLRAYYYGKLPGETVNKNGLSQVKRVYIDLINSTLSERIKPAQGKNGNGRNAYYVNFMADTSMTVQLKLWTRPQTIIKISGFSGNNPFEGFQRKAVVRVRAKFKTTQGIVARVADVPVYQVRRLVNPKGVWRSWDNNNSFHVQLTQRQSVASENLYGFKSEGAWKAYINTTTKDFLTLSGGKVVSDTVFGDTDTPIDFYVNFKGVTAISESNCAIINVEYHGYTCKHTILVRQGYNEPLQLVPGKDKWSSFSVFAATHTPDQTYNDYASQDGTAKIMLTKSPLSLGTYFKRGNLKAGIMEKNDLTYKKDVSFTGNLDIVTYNNDDSNNDDSKGYIESQQKWSNIIGLRYIIDLPNSYNNKYSWPEMETTINGVTRKYTVPTYRQYKDLMDNCECGFGIFYGDGAASTAMNVTTANGFLDEDNKGNGSEKGMRGAIVFNPNTAHQLFFPLGSQGIGRRRFVGSGVLQYSSSSTVLSYYYGAHNQYRPICYNMPNAPGAIYWIRYMETSEVGDILGWDINYNDLNFAPYDYAVAWQKSNTAKDTDALPIRLVVKE